jgi:hypothetical protein
MWNNLPSNLRTILGSALVLGIGVTAAAFTLSFFALRSAASNPQLEFGRGHEWLFPIALDMGLVFAEVLLLGASMVRNANRAIPVLLVLAFGLGTVYFNVTRVPPEVRLITAVPPFASIFMTIGLAYLFKMLTSLSGGVQSYHAPPPQYGQLGPPGSPIQAAMWRGGDQQQTQQQMLPPGSGGEWVGQHPYWSAQRPNPQIGQTDSEESKADAVRAYLRELPPSRQALETKKSVARAMSARGVQLDETWAQKILSEPEFDQRPSGNGNGRKR